MKEIKLTQGKVALVDDEDFEYLNQWKWHACRDKVTWYAGHAFKQPSGRFKTKTMHRFILNPLPIFEVDHIDGNGLNNQRENLRVATRSENNRNCSKRRTNTSGYKGVTWHKRDKEWRAQIGFNKKKIAIGSFDSKVGAARAYNEAALRYFGEFAKLNDV